MAFLIGLICVIVGSLWLTADVVAATFIQFISRNWHAGENRRGR